MTDDDRIATRPALVRAMRLESAGVLSLELAPVDGELPEWEPGAHLDLVLPDGLVRSYSLCGTPGDPAYRIAVLREELSRGGSLFVHDTLRVGGHVEVRMPRNHFALEPASGYLFIAGGIGITPLLPMIAAAESSGTPWRLLYAGRERASMAFLGELARYGDRVTVVARDEAARLDLATELAALADGELVYVCGPERMLEGVRESLGDRAETVLRTELFAAPERDDEPGDAFTVELQASGLTLSVPAEKSILEVVTAAGIDVLTDCEEGICGSCETRVLLGVPEHRDYVLTAQEKQENSCMMICVSRSSTPKLVLDL